jgi:hypothetical protein
MKVLLALALCAVSGLAQAQTPAAAAACGPQGVTFQAGVGNFQRTQTRPEPSKAQVYFIQDDGPYGHLQHYTIKIGLDGAWVGAYKSNSYFQLSVDTGEHHICADVQSNSYLGSLMELAHFTGEPGKTYYFRTRFLAGIPGNEVPYLHLEQADSDQAIYLIGIYPLSVSKPKK